MKVLLGNLDSSQFVERRKLVMEDLVAQSSAVRDEALLAEGRARVAHARLSEEHARLLQQNAALQLGRPPPGFEQQLPVSPLWPQAKPWSLPAQCVAAKQQRGRNVGGYLAAERPSLGSQASTTVGASSREPSPSISVCSCTRHEESLAAEPQHTTLILRNLPIGYSRNELLEMLDREGFNGKYDLVYHPIDFGTRLGFGYAFVNFVSALAAAQCSEHLNGFIGWKTSFDKACEISQSTELQGLEAHIERYRNSPVMHETVPDEFKPATFGDGHRIPFPLPTKKVTKPRAPRVRRQEMRVAKRLAME